MMMQSTEYGGKTIDSFLQPYISFLEHHNFMDITIICGNQTYHAHKVCLGAVSPYLRDELDKNAAISQIVMNGVPGHIIKIILEYVYYGGMSVISSAEDGKMIGSVARFLKIQGLDTLGTSNSETDDIIPTPTFLTKEPRHPSAYVGLHPNPANPGPNQACNSIYAPEVEQVYLREAEAATSKTTVDYLRQQIGNYFCKNDTKTPHTVTNVEPYIPITDGVDPIPANYDIVSQPIQMNYDLNQGIAKNESDVVTIDVTKEENPEWMNILNFEIDNNLQEAIFEAYKGLEDTLSKQEFEDINNEILNSQNLNFSYLPDELEMLNSTLNEVTIPYSSKLEDDVEESPLE